MTKNADLVARREAAVPALAHDRVVQLGDLIALRQVRVEVVLAVKGREQVDVRFQAQSGAHGLRDAFLVDDGQHSGHARVHEGHTTKALIEIDPQLAAQFQQGPPTGGDAAAGYRSGSNSEILRHADGAPLTGAFTGGFQAKQFVAVLGLFSEAGDSEFTGTTAILAAG